MKQTAGSRFDQRNGMDTSRFLKYIWPTIDVMDQFFPFLLKKTYKKMTQMLGQVVSPPLLPTVDKQ